MHVAVFGAGSLGGVYGVKLALHGGVDVTFVVRKSRVSSTDPIIIETVRGNKRESIDEPTRSDVVPADADVVLLCVGTEDLDALKGPLAGSSAPIVLLTPMMPKEWARVKNGLGADRVFAAIPSVIAYVRKNEDDGDGGKEVVRCWLPPAPTKIDEPKPGNPSLEIVSEFASALSRAGLRGKLSLGVHEQNPATTVCFIAIGMVMAIAGSYEALVADEALLSLTTNACREGVRLSARIGDAEPWARLAPALAAPWALRAWLGGLKRLSPEAIFYAEEHFGRKLKVQHRVMIKDMIDLAREKMLPHEAFDELQSRLSATH